MLDEKDIRFLREIFSSYNYIMTTAQLDAERLFYRTYAEYPACCYCCSVAIIKFCADRNIHNGSGLH